MRGQKLGVIGRPTLAMAIKDLTDARRRPQFPAIVVTVSLVFVAMYALIVEVSATTPIAVANAAGNPASDRFVDVLSDMSTVDGPMFEIRTTDPHRAHAMYADGEVDAVLEIPTDFDAAVEHGREARLELAVFNINSDLTKNVELRIERAIRDFVAAEGGEGLAGLEEHPTFAHDMPISTYLGTALVMFAVVFGAMVTTGTLIAKEWEDHTAKMAVLAPCGYGPLIIGKWLGAAVLTAFTAMLVLGGLGLLLDYPIAELGAASALVLLTLFGYGAALGALLGVTLRRSLALVPLSVVVAVTHLLVSGYESYIRGFAHRGAIEWLWRLTEWWPMAALTDQIRHDVTGLGGPAFDWAALGWTAAVAVALTAFAVTRLRRHLVFAQSQ